MSGETEQPVAQVVTFNLANIADKPIPTIPVSRPTYDELVYLLKQNGFDHLIRDNGALSLYGILLVGQ